MNKFKHVTPTNIAPLGKRQSNMVSFIKKEEHHKLQNENHKQVMAITNNIHTTQSNDLQQNQAIQQSHQQSHNITHISNSQHQQNHNDVLHQTQLHQNHSQQSGGNISLQLHHQQMTWSCELCGRMFPTREEWTIHAKSHLEVSFNCTS